MKKIIDGLLYDTEAEGTKRLGERSYLYPGDHNYLSEELYRTASGRFFLAGEGGANSDYRTLIPGGASEGRDIRALDEDQAYRWMEEHADVETTLEHFPDHVQEA